MDAVVLEEAPSKWRPAGCEKAQPITAVRHPETGVAVFGAAGVAQKTLGRLAAVVLAARRSASFLGAILASGRAGRRCTTAITPRTTSLAQKAARGPFWALIASL